MREDLCFEAIRLALLLGEHPEGEKPKTHTLLALICFHAARLSGRMDDDGGLIQLEMQDRSKWDQDLMGRGFHFLEKASMGNQLSEYHLEAGIASLHCAAPIYEKTEWVRILELYDVLYQLKPSPIVALNRAIALGKALGAGRRFGRIKKNSRSCQAQGLSLLSGGPRGISLSCGPTAEAGKHFEKAMKLARSRSEMNFFDRKLKACR